MERIFKKQQNEHINSAGVNGSSQKITDNQTRIARGIQECIQTDDSVMDELTGIVGEDKMTFINAFFCTPARNTLSRLFICKPMCRPEDMAYLVYVISTKSLSQLFYRKLLKESTNYSAQANLSYKRCLEVGYALNTHIYDDGGNGWGKKAKVVTTGLGWGSYLLAGTGILIIGLFGVPALGAASAMGIAGVGCDFIASQTASICRNKNEWRIHESELPRILRLLINILYIEDGGQEITSTFNTAAGAGFEGYDIGTARDLRTQSNFMDLGKMSMGSMATSIATDVIKNGAHTALTLNLYNQFAESLSEIINAPTESAYSAGLKGLATLNGKLPTPQWYTQRERDEWHIYNLWGNNKVHPSNES